MSSDGLQPFPTPTRLKPLSVQIAAPPEAICVALLRHAATPSVIALPEGKDGRASQSKWDAQREGDRPVVSYRLKDGPLGLLHLRFSAEPAEPGTAVLWVSGEFALRRSLLKGALERWRAQRDAEALRDGVVAAVKGLLTGAETPDTRALRRSERRRVAAPARLHVAGREWRAEVLDVSEGGMALVLATPPAQFEQDMSFLRDQGSGEVEIVLLGVRSRTPVLIRRATTSRGGIAVGLQVLEPERIVPLLRKAGYPTGDSPRPAKGMP